MFCTKCGTLLSDDETYCPKCGNKVSVKEDEADNDNILSLVCESCGSTKFKMIRKGEYVCRYCGSTFFMKQDEPPQDDPDVSAKLFAIFQEAAKHEENNKYKKELQVLSQGLEIAPDDCTLLTKLGRVYWRLGMFDWSRKYLEKAERLYPNDPVVYNNIALLYLSKNLYAEALPYFEKSVALAETDPISVGNNDTAVIYGNYALCLGLLGDIEQARKYLGIAKKKGYRSGSIKNVCKRLKIDPSSI